jgi:hypothetical protein
MSGAKEQPKNQSLEGCDPTDHAEFPIFLLGNGRCGSTLLQKILNSVDNIVIYGEHGGFLRHIAAAYFLNLEDKKIEKYITSQNVAGEDPASVLESLKNPQVWSAWTNWYNRETVKNNFRDFIDSFFNPISLGRKLHWGFKEIRYGLGDRVLEMLADLYPKGRFIFMVRHPVEVVASKIGARMSEGIETDAHRWVEQNSHFLNFCRQNKGRSRVFHYEDLISKNNSQLKQVFDWLGFPLRDKQISIIKATKPSYHGRPGPVQLTEDQIDEINKITKEFRKALDY